MVALPAQRHEVTFIVCQSFHLFTGVGTLDGDDMMNLRGPVGAWPTDKIVLDALLAEASVVDFVPQHIGPTQLTPPLARDDGPVVRVFCTLVHGEYL